MRKLLVVMFCIALISLVGAKQITQTPIFDEGYIVEYPKYDYVSIGNYYNYTFHVFNISNGVNVFNDVSCRFHLYDEYGEEVIVTPARKIHDGFSVYIDAGNFSEKKMGGYLTHCNSSSKGGYNAGTFQINQDGLDPTNTRAIMYVGLLGILIFLFLVNLGGLSLLPNKNVKDDDGNIISPNKLKYLRPVLFVVAWVLLTTILFFASNVSFLYFNSNFAGDLFFAMYQILMTLAIPMVIIWLVWIIAKIFQDRELKNMIERGVEFEEGRNP